MSIGPHRQPFVLRTSDTEIRHILIAWLVISLAFALVRIDLFSNIALLFSTTFIVYLVISAVTGGIGFLFHELAHKIAAQRYGCAAEFRADFNMLILSLIISVFGFVIAAPGAVYIFGRVTTKQNGIISVVGPLVNIVLALFFLPFIFLPGVWHDIGAFGLLINAWLALFNMLPISVLDGRKVWLWNKPVFFAVIIASAILVFVGFSVF